MITGIADLAFLLEVMEGLRCPYNGEIASSALT